MFYKSIPGNKESEAVKLALIEQTLDGRQNKVDIAIKRIRSFAPIENGFLDTPYYVGYSGGKDSDAIRILTELAGVKYDLMHNHTTLDAPETVRYVRSIPGIQISYPEITMWQLIVKKLMPPTRIIRYCCAYLKEREGKNRFVMTGVRWAESSRRKTTRSSVEIGTRHLKNKIMLNADNSEDRKLFENCMIKSKRMINPIIDWSDDDVWEFLRSYGCRSNPLYECGDKRIGCVGCPLARPKERERDFERYPAYKINYIKAFDRMIEHAISIGKRRYTWESGQQVFDWWMTEPVRKKKTNDSQLKII